MKRCYFVQIKKMTRKSSSFVMHKLLHTLDWWTSICHWCMRHGPQLAGVAICMCLGGCLMDTLDTKNATNPGFNAMDCTVIVCNLAGNFINISITNSVINSPPSGKMAAKLQTMILNAIASLKRRYCWSFLIEICSFNWALIDEKSALV